MKMIKSLSFAFSQLMVLLFLAYGCTKDDVLKSRIICDESVITVSAEGGECIVSFSVENPASGYKLYALCDDSWLKVQSVSQEEGEIIIVCQPNDLETVRETSLNIYYGSALSSVSVMQLAESFSGDFTFNQEYVTDWNVKYSISYVNPNTSYLYGIEKKENYERFSDDSYFFDYIMEEARKSAVAEGKDLDEVLSSMISSGNTECYYDSLLPDTDYIVYSFPIDMHNELMGDMGRQSFSTGDPITFELDFDIHGPVVKINTVPSYDNRAYYSSALTVDECEGDESNVENAIMKLLNQEISYFAWYSGYTIAEYVDLITETTSSTKRVELYEATDYFGLALCLDTTGKLASEVAVEQFKTGIVEPSDNVITINISNISSTGADWAVTVTDEEDTYLFFVDESANWSGKTDKDIMDEVSAIAPTMYYGRYGNSNGQIVDLKPGTEHIAFAFGCVAGKITTGLTKVYFNTLQ